MQEYQDFHWASLEPANGKSGKGLADLLLALSGELRQVHNVCDLGCGNGYLAGKLAELGYRVTGVDASRKGIKIARENYPHIRFVRSLLNAQLTAEIATPEFDLVISSDVIEHLYRPSDLLNAANSLLRPNGHLLICTPYHGYLKNLVLSLTGRMDSHFTALWDGGHIKFFSVKTLSELIKGHGFADLRFSFYGRAPYLWKNMICHARKNP
jgi:2-polyprenyl-3-methyl-5-hydroxy-6-metoxy-1,4-benzoquinol methylase